MNRNELNRFILSQLKPIELRPLSEQERARLRSFVGQIATDMFLAGGVPVRSVVVREDEAASPLALYDVCVRFDR